MPFQLLDQLSCKFTLVSGLLALMRGFTREVLSLVAWGASAFAAYFAIKQQALLDLAMPYVDKPILAQIAVGAIAFVITLIVVSLISVKISDLVVVLAAGAFDRTLLDFSMAWPVVLFSWPSPIFSTAGSCPSTNRKTGCAMLPRFRPSRPWVETLLGFMPPDIAETLSNTALMKNSGRGGHHCATRTQRCKTRSRLSVRRNPGAG